MQNLFIVLDVIFLLLKKQIFLINQIIGKHEFELIEAEWRISPGAKMGTWKCLRVQCFMIDPESIGVLKEIKLGCHDGNLGELFLFA